MILETLKSGISVYKLKSKIISKIKPWGTPIYNFQCPFCKKWFHSRVATTNHLKKMANKESVEKTAGSKEKTVHLDFYLKNTQEIVIRKREWIIPIH